MSEDVVWLLLFAFGFGSFVFGLWRGIVRGERGGYVLAISGAVLFFYVMVATMLGAHLRLPWLA